LQPACDAVGVSIFNQMCHHIGNLPLVTAAGALPIRWRQGPEERFETLRFVVKPLGTVSIGVHRSSLWLTSLYRLR
jgi:hypothetical protein